MNKDFTRYGGERLPVEQEWDEYKRRLKLEIRTIELSDAGYEYIADVKAKIT